jgi:hypothetical protein
VACRERHRERWLIRAVVWVRMKLSALLGQVSPLLPPLLPFCEYSGLRIYLVGGSFPTAVVKWIAIVRPHVREMSLWCGNRFSATHVEPIEL